MSFSKIDAKELRFLIGCNDTDKSMEDFTSNWENPYISDGTMTHDDFFNDFIIPFLIDRKWSGSLKFDSDQEMFYKQIRDKIPECFSIHMDLPCNLYINVSPEIGETLVDFMERVLNFNLGNFNLSDFIFCI